MLNRKLFLEYGIVFCFIVGITVTNSLAFDLEAVQGAWSFDEGKGNQVLDSSGKENHGTFSANDIKRVKGKFGEALEFIGGGKVVIPHADGFTSPIFTIMAWVNVPKVPNDWSMMIVGKDGWPNRNYAMYVASGTGQLHFAFCAQGKQDVGNVNSNKAIADGKWHHVAMTYDQKMRRIYIDGELDIEAPSTEKPSENMVDIEIGRGPVGTIDEVLIANKPFPVEDIKLVLENGLAKALKGEGKAVKPQNKATTLWGSIKLTIGDF
jgi:hypothetical protein